MKKRFVCLIIISVLILSMTSCSAEKIKFDYFGNKFSPFFALHTTDMSINAMIQETLLVTDAEETGERILDAYTKGVGIADITIDDSKFPKTVCTIKIGDDITFSDGTPMTADDVIFSMYVYADTDYEGWSAFNTLDIDGLENYRFNNSFADTITLTDEQLDKSLAQPDDQLNELICEKIINPILEDEMEWVKRAYKNSSYEGTEMGEYMKTYPQAKDLFAFLYSIDKEYDSSAQQTAEQVLKDIKNQYGSDYKTLETVVGIDLTNAARRCARDIIIKNMLKVMGGEKVDYITGIEKIDNKTVKLTLNSMEGNDLDSALGIYVAPLHHYGDTKDYNYSNHRFGFTRGDLASVKGKNISPLGAGRYVMSEYKMGEVIRFEANDNYFRTTNGEKKVSFYATGNSSESKVHGYYVNFENYTVFKN